MSYAVNKNIFYRMCEYVQEADRLWKVFHKNETGDLLVIIFPSI